MSFYFFYFINYGSEFFSHFKFIEFFVTAEISIQDASRLSRHCRQHGLSRCGGSDAHIPQEIGRCWTEVEGDVYRALAEGRTRVFGRAGWRLHSAESHRRCPANKTVRLTLPLRYVKNACQDL